MDVALNWFACLSGVTVTVDKTAQAQTATPFLPFHGGIGNASTPVTAFLTILDTELTIVDSIFTGLNSTMDTVLAITNSTVALRNSSFLGNQAVSSGGILARDSQLAVENCTFTGNTGAHFLLAVQADTQKCQVVKRATRLDSHLHAVLAVLLVNKQSSKLTKGPVASLSELLLSTDRVSRTAAPWSALLLSNALL